jgi:hypothetical protein
MTMNSLCRATASVILILFLALTFTLEAQTNECDIADDWAGGPIVNPVATSCTTPPTDNVWHGFYPGNQTMTCKDCLPSGNRLNTAGNSTCTAYGQKLVIEWAYPIAELYLPVSGGRTVTDNRGMQIKLNQEWPQGGLAYFPGTGITRVEITDPWINEDGEWSIWVSNFHWVDGPTGFECSERE